MLKCIRHRESLSVMMQQSV